MIEEELLYLILFEAVAFFIFLIMLIKVLYDYFNNKDIKSRLEPVEGLIIDTKVNVNKKGHLENCSTTFRFTYNGEEKEDSVDFYFGFEIGEKLNLMYDPIDEEIHFDNETVIIPAEYKQASLGLLIVRWLLWSLFAFMLYLVFIKGFNPQTILGLALVFISLVFSLLKTLGNFSERMGNYNSPIKRNRDYLIVTGTVKYICRFVKDYTKDDPVKEFYYQPLFIFENNGKKGAFIGLSTNDDKTYNVGEKYDIYIDKKDYSAVVIRAE